MEKVKLCPRQIKLSDRGAFMRSGWQNSECETIAYNVVFFLNHINPNVWTPFSWEDYKYHCRHRVTDSELRVLETFVNGGKPVWNTTAVIEPGYLSKDSEGYYHITSKFIDAIPARAKLVA